MKTQKLRILKNDIIYFHIIKYWDKVNGNTYSCFNQGWINRKNARFYLSDMRITNYKSNVSSYTGGEHSHVIVKRWLNENSNLDIRHMSDFPNVIVSEEYLDRKQYNNLTSKP